VSSWLKGKSIYATGVPKLNMFKIIKLIKKDSCVENRKPDKTCDVWDKKGVEDRMKAWSFVRTARIKP
jgi:hypothetical protein